MYGPIEGRRHDAFMLAASGVCQKLEQLQDNRGEDYVVYGDPAYGITRCILAPFRGANLTDDEKEFNKNMSKVRVSVEWGIGKICNYFAYLDFKKNLLRQVLHNWCSYDELYHVLVWVGNKYIL